MAGEKKNTLLMFLLNFSGRCALTCRSSHQNMIVKICLFNVFHQYWTEKQAGGLFCVLQTAEKI